MAQRKASGDRDQGLEEVVRLLAILVMRDRPLQDTIGEMSARGFGPTRIAELVGTSPGYAKVAADRAKKKKTKARPASAASRTKE